MVYNIKHRSNRFYMYRCIIVRNLHPVVQAPQLYVLLIASSQAHLCGFLVPWIKHPLLKWQPQCGLATWSSLGLTITAE